MSLESTVRSVSGRLSLREPQAESRRRLHWAVDQVPALRGSKAPSPEELKAMQDALTGQFPTPKFDAAAWQPAGEALHAGDRPRHHARGPADGDD